MARFAPSTPAHYGAAFGAQSNLSTSTSDAISVARQTYDKSDLKNKALYDYTAVKDRNGLAAYVAPKLRVLVSFIDNDAAGAKAAEQLRYISVTPAYKIGDFIGNNLSYVLKYGPSKDKIELKKAIAYWAANLDKLYFFNYKEREAVKSLAREYELEDVKRQAKAEVESQYAARGGSSSSNAIRSDLRGKTWNDGQYTYEIGSDGLSVKTNGKTFTPDSSAWAKVKSNLEAASLRSGALQRRAPSGGGTSQPATEVATTPSEDAPPAEEGLTQKAWFWPAVILGTTGVGIGAYFLFTKKSDS
jgi:hypothetical protein